MSDSFFRDQDERPAEPQQERKIDSEIPPNADPGKGDLLSDETRLAAIMSYVPFLCLVPLANINWRENEEARFHARQGIVLFVIEIIAVVLLIDDMAKFIFKSILVLAAALAVTGIYFTLQGKRIRLPIISDLADKAKL